MHELLVFHPAVEEALGNPLSECIAGFPRGNGDFLAATHQKSDGEEGGSVARVVELAGQGDEARLQRAESRKR